MRIEFGMKWQWWEQPWQISFFCFDERDQYLVSTVDMVKSHWKITLTSITLVFKVIITFCVFWEVGKQESN
jgi:hypothetical protein